MSENYLAGFVGGGEQAHYLMRHAWTRVPGIQVVGVVDQNPETAARFADTFGVSVAPSIEELARKVDLVAVCTPPGVHAENVMRALTGAGRGRVIGVHCEKPSALKLADHDAMARTARSRNAALTFGYDRLFSAAGWIADMLEHGILGDLDRVEVVWLRFNGIPRRGAFLSKELSGGGPGFDLLPHLISIVMFILRNPEIMRVFGVTHRRIIESGGTMGNLEMAGDVEDSILGIAGLRFRGHPVTLTYSTAWDQPIPENEFEIRLVGTRGSATLGIEPLPNDDERYTARVFALPSPGLGRVLPPRVSPEWQLTQGFAIRKGEGPLFELRPPVDEPTLAQCRSAQLANLAETVAALRAGQRREPLVTPDLARRVLEFVIAAYNPWR